jgi:ABC-2 type transport system permease protein
MVGIGAVWQTSVIVFASVLLTHFPAMGGWTSDDVLLMASMRLVSHGLFVLLFGRISWLSSMVQEGRIDGFLLRPLPVYRQVQLSFFNTNAIGDLLVAGMLFAGALQRLDRELTVPEAGYLMAALVGGTLMEAAMATTLSSAALHFPTAAQWNAWLEELLSTFGNYPLSIFPRLVRDGLTFLVPVAFIAYLPVAVLTDHDRGLGVPEALAVSSPVVGLMAFVASRYLWNWSLQRYSGVNG